MPLPTKEMAMRVLFWSTLFPPYIGGAEKVAARLVAFLVGQGAKVLVLTSHENLALPDREDFQGASVVRLPMREALRGNPMKLLHCRKAILKHRHEFRPHLDHCFDLGAPLAFYWQTAGRNPAPLFLTLHQRLFNSEPESLTSKMLKKAAWVSGVSEACLAEARQLVPEIQSRSSVILNFEDPPESVNPLPPDPPSLLCLGRLIPAKGFDLALRALPRILDRHPDCRLIVAGDGVEKESLHTLAKELKVQDSIDFLGWVDPQSVFEEISRSHLVCLPSRQEGLPMVAIQAASAGRAIVATQVGGNPEIVKHGESGLIIPPEDTEALTEAILKLLEDRQRLAKWGEFGRRRALTMFSPEAKLKEYWEVYRSLVNDEG